MERQPRPKSFGLDPPGHSLFDPRRPRFLDGTVPYYPSGTVFVTVIDPGVGSARKAVVVKSKRGQYFVLPDNGLITLVEDRDGIEGAREITNPSWMIGEAISSTFHGRDIFFSGRRSSCARRGLGAGGSRARGEETRAARYPGGQEGRKGIAGEIIALDDPLAAWFRISRARISWRLATCGATRSASLWARGG